MELAAATERSNRTPLMKRAARTMAGAREGPTADRFLVGETVTTPSRTVSRADVEAFAHLTGDENRMHLDEAFARQQLFGGIVAHGLLTLSITLGLWYRAGLFEREIVVFSGIEKLRFVKPVRPGDTLSAELKIVRRVPSVHGELVDIDNMTRNGANETVLSFSARLLLAGPPTRSSTPAKS